MPESIVKRFEFAWIGPIDPQFIYHIYLVFVIGLTRYFSSQRQLEKELRAVYAQRKQRISASTGLASAFHIKGARHMGAHDKQRITAEHNANIAPNQVVTTNIDKLVLQFDGIKVKISAWLVSHNNL